MLAKLLKQLNNNGGFTMKNGKVVRYKTGYQVATTGKECKTINETLATIRKYNGNCGIWLSNGIYYIDKCSRIPTKKEAIKVGKTCKQQSIYDWKKKDLIWL